MMDVFGGTGSPKGASATYNDSLYRETVTAGGGAYETPNYHINAASGGQNSINHTGAGVTTENFTDAGMTIQVKAIGHINSPF